ncbi:serine protease [Streptomyces fuscichromogenes]|uniref:S1 family peptidase n=1 Tax=Streptomyces fuscichromogenes TaxID=1324013 RepID=UPI0037F4378C
MGELRADWRLRLRRGDAHGPVCGAGVLVDQHTALTCAHVVRHPDAVMWVEFAENGALEPVAAHVPPGGWLSEGEHGEDVAVLRLDSPRPRARPARLEPRFRAGTEVYATGYAEGFDDGMSLWGRIGGASGELVQLDAVTKAEVVRAGFSGAAVCTRPQDGRPARVVGLVVSWRGDLGELLPEGNRLAFSYLIPVDRIAELSPLVAELTRPDAWDHDFGERLTRWFGDPDEDPVKITVVPPETGRDRSLRHLLHLADIVHRGGDSRPQLADHALGRISFPVGEYLAHWDWLLGTARRPRGAPASVPGPGAVLVPAPGGPVRPVTVVVDGLDEEPRPGPLLELLGRLRELDFRLLLVFRHEGGPGWSAARDELLRPALLRQADALLGRLESLELGDAVRRDVVGSASLGPVTETAELRRAERRRIGALPDPQRQLTGLRALIRSLRADLDRRGGR